jgi:hypothetical protein
MRYNPDTDIIARAIAPFCGFAQQRVSAFGHHYQRTIYETEARIIMFVMRMRFSDRYFKQWRERVEYLGERYATKVNLAVDRSLEQSIQNNFDSFSKKRELFREKLAIKQSHVGLWHERGIMYFPMVFTPTSEATVFAADVLGYLQRSNNQVVGVEYDEPKRRFVKHIYTPNPIQGKRHVEWIKRSTLAGGAIRGDQCVTCPLRWSCRDYAAKFAPNVKPKPAPKEPAHIGRLGKLLKNIEGKT